MRMRSVVLATGLATVTGFLWAGLPDVSVSPDLQKSALAQMQICEWAATTAPAPSFFAEFSGITVITPPKDAWAVGSYTPPSSSRPRMLAEHWDGNGWSVAETPVLVGSNSLFAVDAITTNDVWAVGNHFVNDSRTETVTVHYDGVGWEHVPSPNPGNVDTFLYDLDARATDDVWAVGGAVDERGQVTRTLVIRWNGTDWNVIPSRNPSAYNVLNGVFARTATDVWAVGFTTDDVNGAWETLIEHWDGEQWSVIPSPSTGAGDQLYDIGGVSKNDLWAVGWSQGPTTRTLVEHWNGTEGSVVPSESVGHLSVLRAVAVAGNTAWAVGFASGGDGRNRALIQSWNGSDWEVVSAGDADLSQSQLLDVAAHSASGIWAVGSTRSLEPLIEAYCPKR